MIIRNAVEAGQELADKFISVDSLENVLGWCLVEPIMNDHLMPERPLDIKISLDCREEAELQLLAAAMARAMFIARSQNPSVNARIYTECAQENDRLMENLRMLGFSDNDMLVRMRRRIIDGPNIVRMPEGCVFVTDRLTDPSERRFFLERAKQLFKIDRPEQWLDTVSAKSRFKRLLISSRDGLAGELLCWTEPGCGIIGHVYTAPSWRQKGIATYLMEAARQYFYQCHLPEATIDVRWRMTAASRLAATAGYRRSETLTRLPGIDLDA